MDVTNIAQYIKPEMLVVAVCLYILGIFLKRSQAVKDKLIPFILLLVGIGLAIIWVMATATFSTPQDIALAVFTAIVQGILVTGAAVLTDQLVKQSKKE